MGLNENEILKVKKYVDNTEIYNQIDPKELVESSVIEHLVPKPQNMITEDKNHSITRALNQRIYESLNWFSINREKNNLVEHSLL